MKLDKKPFKIRVYPTPRMAINPLTEYATASASRRNAIIKDSRTVPTYIVKRYNLASEIITQYLTEGVDDLSLLRIKMVELKNSKYAKPFDKEMAMYSLEALRAFYHHATMCMEIFKSFRLEAAISFSYHKLNIEGVEVSIRPELLIKNDNNEIIGFIKLYFSKSKELEGERAELITCLGRNYFNESHSLNLSEKNCFVLDVFNGEITSAPRAFKRRMSDIIASCREIADRWNSFN